MSVGNCIRKMGSELNVGLRMCKFMGGFQPKNVATVLGTSKGFQLPQVAQINPLHNSMCVSENEGRKFYFISPKVDMTIRKSIIVPEKGLKINFELPIRNSTVTALDLPLHTEKEIMEPGKVISKKAEHMLRIRKRKMRKHKRKKYMKKFATVLAKRKLKREMELEANLQTELRTILSEKETFSPEKYVEDVLDKVHWERPVTKVRGRLAPKWVIREYLQEKEEKRILRARIKECLK